MSTLLRVPEPEIMDTAVDAEDYDAMDHSQINDRFARDLLSATASRGSMLDVGTGTGLIPFALLAADPAIEQIVGADLSEEMLKLARRTAAARGYQRASFDRVDGKALPYGTETFDVVFSNSLVHHVSDPRAMFAEKWRVLKRGGTLFVRDLFRPENKEQLLRELALSFPEPGPTDPNLGARWERQRALLEASFYASYTLGEIAAFLREAGVPQGSLLVTSPRHWTLHIKKG